MATAQLESTADVTARVRQIGSEAQALEATVEETVRDLESYVRERMERHPYTMLAAAAGVGYVVGGGMPSRLTGLLIALGSRVVLEVAARELTARFARQH